MSYIIKISFNRVPGNNITFIQASLLFETLKGCNAKISCLDLSTNQIDDNCMHSLGQFLENNQHLEKLYLSDNEITDKGIEILSEYFIGNIEFRELDLDNNEGITDASVPFLLEIAKNSCITKMNLKGTSIYDQKKKTILKLLSIPIDKREFPIQSRTKSAAKITSAST